MEHSLGPTCQYYEPEIDGEEDGPPKINAQFFYISSVPIDDPLSPVPPVVPEKPSTKHPTQPFSARDNAALEEAWQGFQSIVNPSNDAKLSKDSPHRMVSFPRFKRRSKSKGASSSEMVDGSKVQQEVQQQISRSSADPGHLQNFTSDNKSPDATLKYAYQKLPNPPSDNLTKAQNRPKQGLVSRLSSFKHKKESDPPISKFLSDSGGNMATTSVETYHQARPGDALDSVPQQSHKKYFSSGSSEPDVMISQISKTDSNTTSPIDPEELRKADRSASPHARNSRDLSPLRHLRRRLSKDDKKHLETAELDSRDLSHRQRIRSKIAAFGKNQGDATNDSDASLTSAQESSSHMSGRPFARAPSQRNLSRYDMDGPTDVTPYDEEEFQDSSPVEQSKIHKALHPHLNAKETKKRAYVPVGVSKLHLVELPSLVMKPIYWSPLNDQASVIRATWFFKDTMEPVDAELANRLEVGYEDMKPYSDVYQHELDSCIEHGASAELKVVHKLWPEERKPSRPSTSNGLSVNVNNDEQPLDDGPLPLISELNAAADNREPHSPGAYATHSVIYIDEKNAQILKPSLLPNESRGRKPLSAIRKGRPIGVPVVRGFDRKAWEKVHISPKMNEKVAAAKVGGYISQSGDATTRGKRASCPVCDAQEVNPQPAHLVLVIHGIGQKLSERVDSYHFTHAINGLRRELNVELASDSVRKTIGGESGIMVLPVNWRLNISFEEDQTKAKKAAADNSYSLADITPDTLPAVRSLISDVMLDIPYYLSHHKDKMTAAVVKEANRVYRLWCRNNPGFQQNGQVHLVAHSLGSVMAMDILSQQPTHVPTTLDLMKQPVNETTFEFDTKSLFSCGSPSGFFLLLNNATLIPRKGRSKPGADNENLVPGLTGEAGIYGCLAVDNLYNICHKNDPVAYQQNACVDKAYAASLVPANIPSANASILAKIGGSLRLSSSPSSNVYDAPIASQRPTMTQLPSTVELETHNFTREDIAERRMYLINDNGQIDFFLSSGGGPLEFQYINMLSAHSSYWLLQDFARFLVMEIGRQPGKENTWPQLRAVKKREYKKGEMK